MRGFLLGVLSSASMLAIVSLAGQPAMAIDDAPAKPKIDCKKAENKNKPACKKANHMSDDELVNAAYWMAREGQYKGALELLLRASNQDDVRVLTATGFATRKLGDVDGALPLYARALAQNPDYVQAREYLGEAYLTKGDLARASEQLREIETRCGTQCAAYAELDRQIGLYKAGAERG